MAIKNEFMDRAPVVIAGPGPVFHKKLQRKGEEEWLLPVKALHLPERYHQPWGDAVVPVVSYRTPEGVIWGITGDILQDFLQRYRNVQESFGASR